MIAFVVVVLCARATASPYDVAWSTFSVGLGASPELTGALDGRMARLPCELTCPLSSRFVLGGGLGRVGVEVQLASGPLEDTQAMDYRDRSRNMLRVGPLARYTIVRRWGFDVSGRGGVQFGALTGDSSSTTDPESQRTTTYSPDSYSMAALTVGATLMWRVRVEGGFFGLMADLDYSFARVWFPDDARSGGVVTQTYGFVMGSMFDLPR